MTAAPDRTTDLEIVQLTLQAAHRNRIRDLTLTPWEDEVELGGEAVSFYAVQLVIRDVLAAGVRIRRNHIRVRHTTSENRTPRAESQPADRPVTRLSAHVVLACADPRQSAEVAEHLRDSGYEVETTQDGVSCIGLTCRRTPEVLTILGRLPWGGTDGVIEALAEAGRLDSTAVFYAGPEDGLGSLSPACRRRLAGGRFTPDPCGGDLLELLRNGRATGAGEHAPSKTS